MWPFCCDSGCVSQKMPQSTQINAKFKKWCFEKNEMFVKPAHTSFTKVNLETSFQLLYALAHVHFSWQIINQSLKYHWFITHFTHSWSCHPPKRQEWTPVIYLFTYMLYLSLKFINIAELSTRVSFLMDHLLRLFWPLNAWTARLTIWRRMHASLR